MEPIRGHSIPLALVRALATVFAGVLLSACPVSQAPRPLLAPAPDSPIAVLGAPGSIAMGEVNGDGKPDIVTSNLESNGVTVLLAQ
jgi:hypothetical protein